MNERPASLHQRILDEIAGKILSGAWPPGHRIPFEHELTATYGCSRMTVNKALSELARAGLIERKRKSGSTVTRPRSQAAVLEIHDIRTEVEALGLAYRYELLLRQRRKAIAAERADIGLPAGAAVVAVKARHLAGGQPFCLEDRLISLDAVPLAAQEDFASIAPGAWLIGHVPWSAAEHTIRAVAADEQAAKELGITAGAACLVVERRTWSADKPVTFVRLTYAGDSHALVARFAP
jgi:GntR family histidine utilization transcriptional repressor